MDQRPGDWIVITGASTGLGAALARYYARPGYRLAITARSEERLADTVSACRQAGATVQPAGLDVRDSDGMRAWLDALADEAPLGLVIANAGISGGAGAGRGPWGEDDAQARAIFAVNLDGVVNTLNPAAAIMCRQGRGQLCVISSLAGLRGLGSAPAYSASKTGARAYGEALAAALAPFGVRVSVVLPGFIATPLTAANSFRMPMLMRAETAAARTARGLRRGAPRIAFPLPLYMASWLLAALPERLAQAVLQRLPAKA